MGIYYGIDPGKKGVIVEVNTFTKVCRYMIMPWKPDGCLDQNKILTYFDFNNASAIVIEDVHADQKMAAKSAFSFGWNVGQINLIISDYRYTKVNPLTWQAKFHADLRLFVKCPKERSAMLFQRYNPSFGKIVKCRHEDMIDAYFIAKWGALERFPNDLTFMEIT